MENRTEFIKKIKELREQVLVSIYEETSASTAQGLDLDLLFIKKNFDKNLVHDVYLYLLKEDLIEAYGRGHTIYLTHDGIKYVENI